MKITIEIPLENIPKGQDVINLPLYFMNGELCSAGGYEFSSEPRIRDCENCIHHTENGCGSWECEFEEKGEQNGDS